MTEKSKAALEVARGVVRGNREVFLINRAFVPDEAQRARLYEAYYIKMAHEFKMLKRNFFEYHLDVDRGSGTNPKRVRERIPNFILWIVCCGRKGSGTNPKLVPWWRKCTGTECLRSSWPEWKPSGKKRIDSG